MADAEEMTAWLISTQLASDQNIERLKELVILRFREQQVEPPRNDRIERLIRSTCHTYEQTLFAEIFQKLPQVTRERFDADRPVQHALAESPPALSAACRC